MITTFEEKTYPISEYEKNILLPRVTILFKALDKGTVITNGQIRDRLLESGIKVPATRIRKIIHLVRNLDRVPLLIATSKGYKIAETDKEVEDYLQSLKERIERISETRHSIIRQREQSKNQPTIWDEI